MCCLMCCLMCMIPTFNKDSVLSLSIRSNIMLLQLLLLLLLLLRRWQWWLLLSDGCLLVARQRWLRLRIEPELQFSHLLLQQLHLLLELLLLLLLLELLLLHEQLLLDLLLVPQQVLLADRRQLIARVFLDDLVLPLESSELDHLLQMMRRPQVLFRVLLLRLLGRLLMPTQAVLLKEDLLR